MALHIVGFGGGLGCIDGVFGLGHSKSWAVGLSRPLLVASLLLVAMPFATSSFLLLLVMPGAPSSVLAPTRMMRMARSFKRTPNGRGLTRPVARRVRQEGRTNFISLI